MENNKIDTENLFLLHKIFKQFFNTRRKNFAFVSEPKQRGSLGINSKNELEKMFIKKN